MKNILVLNGPNLNYLGKRQVEIYGKTTLEEVKNQLKSFFPNYKFYFKQSNHEGQLIDWIQQTKNESIHGLLFNPGAYSHSSIALGDALTLLSIPKIEIHISNIYKREHFRHTLITAPHSHGVIIGFGIDSYMIGIYALSRIIDQD